MLDYLLKNAHIPELGKKDIAIRDGKLVELNDVLKLDAKENIQLGDRVVFTCFRRCACAF